MRHTFAAAAAIALIGAVPAYGQIWIGEIAGQVARQGNSQGDRRCLAGEFEVSERRVERAREGVQAAMNAYVGLARIGTAANVESAFPAGAAKLRMNDAPMDARAADDSIARSLAPGEMLGSPDAIFEAGDRDSFAAQWIVRDAEGAVAGNYVGVFQRSGRSWRLVTLTAQDASHEVAPLQPYCHAPGDIELQAQNAARLEEWRRNNPDATAPPLPPPSSTRFEPGEGGKEGATPN